MTEQAEPFFESGPAKVARVQRNPFELALGAGGAAAFGGGVIMSGVAQAAYARESDVTALANTLSGAFQQSVDGGALAWATFGNQLSTIGVVVLIGMAFYWMIRWNQANQA